MAFVRILFHLSLLLLWSSVSVCGATGTVYHPPAEAPHPAHGHHHHRHPHHTAPSTYSPVHPPKKPLTHPPVYPPVQSLAHPPAIPSLPAYQPVKPPVHPPKSPVHPYVKPPVRPPVHPPVYPPSNPSYPPQRKYVGIRGTVLCKACKYKGVDNLTAAAPLPGAVVQLKCKNTKYPFEEKTTTDKNGYFIFTPKMVTTFGVHKCIVSLVSSPVSNCSHPTNLHGGVSGATPYPTLLPPVPNTPPPQYVLYSLDSMAFEPPKKFPCQY